MFLFVFWVWGRCWVGLVPPPNPFSPSFSEKGIRERILAGIYDSQGGGARGEPAQPDQPPKPKKLRIQKRLNNLNN